MQMRKLKQWEEEKRVIEEGLRVINSAQDWYKSRLTSVNDRVKFGGDPSANSAATTEANQVSNHFSNKETTISKKGNCWK